MRIYLAAPFSFRREMRAWAETLVEDGHTITAHWLSEEANDDDGDVSRYAEYWARDFDDVKAADVLLAYIPDAAHMSRRGTMLVETGVALALGKQVVIVSERERNVLPLPAAGQARLLRTFHDARLILRQCKQPQESVVQEAHRLVHGDRGAAYGHPYDDYSKTVGAFNALTGHKLTPAEGILYMVCVKLSRECNVPKRDNLTDAAGYVECLHMVREREKELKAG